MDNDNAWYRVLNPSRKSDKTCITVIREMLNNVWSEYNEDDTLINNMIKFEAAGGKIMKAEYPSMIGRPNEACYEVTLGRYHWGRVFDIDV